MAAPMPLLSIRFTFPTSEARPKPSLMFSRTRSLRLCISTARPGCRNTIQLRKLEDFPVQKKVHSLAVDKDTHRVYAPEQEVDGRPAARITVYEALSGQAATLR